VDEWTRIMNEIESDKYEYISFDIFDTLLLRPFWDPTDLFYFVGVYAMSLNIVKNELEFMKIRKKAEEIARLRVGRKIEDITIDEIYDTLKKLLHRNSDIESLMKYETNLELNFCYRRQSGYELYCKAIKSNKRVICISDMYLKKQKIEELLHKNGYSQFEMIYLSSETRLGKYTGHLYQHVLEHLNIEQKEKIMHIGDNYHSDIRMSQINGLNAFYLKKTKDLYLSDEDDLKIHLLSERIKKAIEVNTKYDNPFIQNNNIEDKVNFDQMFQNYSINIEDCNCFINDKKSSMITKVKNKIIRNLFYKN
jgi:HAD superfamily hydrolase (TIGR01549 family)